MFTFPQANYKISIIRLRHEIEDLKRRVEAMHIKVEAEKKVRGSRLIKQYNNRK